MSLYLYFLKSDNFVPSSLLCFICLCVTSDHNKLTEIMGGEMGANISLLCDVTLRQVIFLTPETALCVSKREEGETTKTCQNRKKKNIF